MVAIKGASPGVETAPLDNLLLARAEERRPRFVGRAAEGSIHATPLEADVRRGAGLLLVFLDPGQGSGSLKWGKAGVT